MNFLPATVEGTTVELPFGTVEISAEKAERAAGKGLLIAGIRPEAFEDASVVDASRNGSTFRATVDVVEWLGNEAYAYIPFEAPPEVRSSSSSSSATSTASPCAPSWSSALDGSSTIAEGDEAEIWVDTSKMHLFDPATGENLTVDRENAGEIPAAAAGRTAD